MKNKNLNKNKYTCSKCDIGLENISKSILGFKKYECHNCKKIITRPLSSEMVIGTLFFGGIFVYMLFEDFPLFLNEFNPNNFMFGVYGPFIEFVFLPLLLSLLFIYALIKNQKVKNVWKRDTNKLL